MCIPTADRPETLERLLVNLTEQIWSPDYVLVVDASRTDATRLLCKRFEQRFPSGCLHYERCARGLTLQRRRGIEILRRLGDIRYVCMLDDDVLPVPDFLHQIVHFMESEEGKYYGGISGYEMLGFGKRFSRLERLYRWLRIFDRELKPGRWLYCGAFLELSRLRPLEEVYQTEYLIGCAMVFRMEALDRFLPPIALTQYALGEDKHWSLRIGSEYLLGILGTAKLWHYHSPGGRANRLTMGYMSIRNHAIILRDCDPNPTARRYLAFLGFNLLHLCIRLFFIVVKFEFQQVPHFLGSLVGWIHCLLVPPKSTCDALTAGPRCVSSKP